MNCLQMKWKRPIKILLGIIALAILVVFILSVFVEPWIEKKIVSTLNENNKGYLIKAETVDFSLFRSGLELKNITITLKPVPGVNSYLNGKISSIRINGIGLMRALFKNGIYLREVIVSNCSIDGRIQFPKKKSPPINSGQLIRIGCILFDTLDLNLEYDSTARCFSLKKGIFRLVDLRIKRKDTLSPAIVREIDIANAQEVTTVSADSMYSFKAGGISYAAVTKTLAADSFFIHPNYPDYKFTSHYEFQKDRIEAVLTKLYIKSFSPAAYFKSGDVISTYIEIGEMNMSVFRDKRKKFLHTKKPTFQDLIYDYPANLRIDSISILSGNIDYAEHPPGTGGQGKINFSELYAKVYQITNDTLYKKEKGYIQLHAQALLMGKSKLAVSLKARLFDSNNSFSFNGALSGFEAEALNPILEYSASLYITSGKIDALNFNFTANNTRATGNMALRYHGLDIAVKNKQTDDTTALKERIISFIANNMILNSNPLPGREVRQGIIDYERDPERFVIGYVFKSMLSGMESTMMRNKEKEKEK